MQQTQRKSNFLSQNSFGDSYDSMKSKVQPVNDFEEEKYIDERTIESEAVEQEIKPSYKVTELKFSSFSLPKIGIDIILICFSRLKETNLSSPITFFEDNY